MDDKSELNTLKQDNACYTISSQNNECIDNFEVQLPNNNKLAEINANDLANDNQNGESAVKEFSDTANKHDEPEPEDHAGMDGDEPKLRNKNQNMDEAPLPIISSIDTSILNNTLGSKTACKICSLPATLTRKRNTRNVLCCHECSELIHFHCSKLPPYMLYSLSTTNKRYICEVCVDNPSTF